MSGRPAPESFLNDIFINRKCGLGQSSDYDTFYGWCSGATNKSHLTSICEITGSELMKCNTTVSFLPKGIVVSTYDQLNANTTPTGLTYSCYCYNLVQPEKSIIWDDLDIYFSKDAFYDYSVSCYTAYYGVIGLPWWIILLIILACIMAVSGAAYLFWKYYLGKVIRKSTLESRLTSAPISTSSLTIRTPRRTSYSR